LHFLLISLCDGALKNISSMFLLDLMGKKVIHWMIYDTLDNMQYVCEDVSRSCFF